MKIGINCLSISPEYAGGINSFTLGLINGFSELKTTHEFVVFVTSGNKFLFGQFAGCANFSLVEIKEPSEFQIKNIDWKSIKLRSKFVYFKSKNFVFSKQTKEMDSKCDVLYTPSTVLYSYNSKVPNILSMHDIQHRHYPSFFTELELMIRDVTYGLSAENSDYMQVSSNYIRKDFLSHFSFLKEEQLRLIEEGVDTKLFSSERDSEYVLNKYKIPANFLFYPAQLWPHKNHITVLKALKLLKEQGMEMPLVMTGGSYNAGSEIFSFIEKNVLKNIFYLGKIPYEDIIALYKQALFLITASLHESSCLPVLEAAAAGVPVIASDIEPNIEMGERLKLNLFSALSHEELASLIIKLKGNTSLLKEQAEYNLKQVQFYDWKNIAEKYVMLFETAYSENKKEK